MKIILYCIQAAVLTFFVVIWIGENTSIGTENNSKWLLISRYTTIGLFSLFLLVYICVLLILTRRLMMYFPKFY